MIEEYEYVKVEGSIFEIKDDFEDGVLYWYCHDKGRFMHCSKERDLFVGIHCNCLYKRIKIERKLNEGEWYPCVDKHDERSVYVYSNGRFFIDEFNLSSEFDVSSMKWIGESLGKIKFG